MTVAQVRCGLSARWLEIRTALLAEAQRLGADTVVTVSHACQREWCDAGEDILAVRNCISLVAEALGCARPSETTTLGQLKHLADPQAIVERTQVNWASYGLTKAQALHLARRYAWASQALRSSAP